MPSDPLLPLEQQRPEQEVPIANNLKLPTQRLTNSVTHANPSDTIYLLNLLLYAFWQGLQYYIQLKQSP